MLLPFSESKTVLLNSDGSLEKLLSELSIESRSFHSYQRVNLTTKTSSQFLPEDVVGICDDHEDVSDEDKTPEFFDSWIVLRFNLSASSENVKFYDSFRDNDAYKDAAFEAQPHICRMRSLLSPSSYQKLLAQVIKFHIASLTCKVLITFFKYIFL